MSENEIQCPFCGESFTVLIDCSEDQQSYIEDCFVCCKPIQFQVNCSDGELINISVSRE